MPPKLLQVVAQAPGAKYNQLGGWRKGDRVHEEGDDIMGQAPPTLSPVCGGIQFTYCSRLGPGTPNHSMKGFWGLCERFWERSLNT